MKSIYKLLITITLVMVSICVFSSTALASEECEHTGGRATCTGKAVCELCGEEYGELDPFTHSNPEEYYESCQEDSTKHNVMWQCCKLFLRTEYHVEDPDNMPTCTEKGSCYRCKTKYLDELPHNFSEPSCAYPKICKDCDLHEGERLPHTGGEAGCLSLAICEVCGVEYGDILGHIGGEATCSKQAVCERCGESYGVCLPHTGGTATCKAPAICTVCKTAYGELGTHIEDTEWKIAKEYHYKDCANPGCTELMIDGDHEDENNDGKCDICQYKYKLSTVQVVLIIVGSTLGIIAVAGGITAIIIIKKKRKNK